MESAHASEFDPWNLERLRLPAGASGKARASDRLPRHRNWEGFLKGPIPFVWIATAARLPGSGLHVATALRFLCDRFRGPNRWGLDRIAAGLGLDIQATRRGLHATEEAGLVSASREPGCKLVATICCLPEPRGEAKRPPLYGPIPWNWWLSAMRLPGASLRVATACWLTGGRERSSHFELALGEWSDLGLTRQAAGRGLESLESAGLVSVTDRPGRSPIVVIQDASSSIS